MSDLVVCGSYRKAPEQLQATYEHLIAVGHRILSPRSVKGVREREGFVFMRGESAMLPDRLEDAHLAAIRRARYVWLHAPDGYVGVSAAMEIGFACAVGVPVYSNEAPRDIALGHFVRVVSGPEAIL